MKGVRFITVSAILLTALAALMSGCAPEKNKTKVVKECVLPEDQNKTLIGNWKVTPVPLMISSQFNGEETAEIVAAAKTWNAFFEASQGIKVFDIGDEGNPRRTTAKSKGTQVCNEGIVQGTHFSGNVGIFKQAPWAFGNHSVIAITSTCPVKKKGLDTFFNGELDINYQDFFINGKKRPDLQSILVHELGHLLGLDHSCAKGGAGGFPDCDSKALPDNYFFAVLFPIIAFDAQGFGEVRRDLNDNDQGRGNCLYSNPGSTQ